MKRIFTILTLLATLGFVMPTTVEAKSKKHKSKTSHSSSHNKKPGVVAQRSAPGPSYVARPGPSRPGMSYYSNRRGPVTIYPAPRRPYDGPRRSLFSLLFRL